MGSREALCRDTQVPRRRSEKEGEEKERGKGEAARCTLTRSRRKAESARRQIPSRINARDDRRHGGGCTAIPECLAKKPGGGELLGKQGTGMVINKQALQRDARIKLPSPSANITKRSQCDVYTSPQILAFGNIRVRFRIMR